MHPILVVDDHLTNCIPLVRLLQMYGYDAAYACCGQDALLAMVARPPRLVLLDLTMPEMDGFQVLQAIRSDHGNDAIAVVMYTAVADAAARSRAALLGAQGYVVKGTSFADLHAEVRRHLPAA